MLNIDSIQNGIVIDHIQAGKGMRIYELLELDKLDCCVALIKNARSSKMGRKDIIKIEGDLAINFDVLGFIDNNITVCTIKNGELVKKENYPMASEVIFGSFSDISGKVALTANDYAVVMTPGHQADYEILSQVLKSSATYIGCIGSRTKVAKTRERLKGDGYTEEDIARVHAPIGLPILAETPEEIAISIAAEMIEHRARLAGQRH